MEGVLERAWNHPPLDKCLELVEDSTERSTRGVTERWARRRPRAPASGRRSNSAGTFGHGPRWIAALGGRPASDGPRIHAVPSARACAPFPCACEDDGCSRARLRP